MSSFKQGGWLVYLNGIEVPCPSLSVSYGVGVLPTATLNFAPHHLLQRLGNEDRVEVVIFYYDSVHEAFCLLFEGEIIGWSYQNSPFGRSMNFNAVADIQVLETLYFFFLNNVDTAVAANHKGVSADTFVQPGALRGFSLFKKGLFVDKNSTGENVDRPFEILYNAVRLMVSNKVSSAHKSVPAANFFSRWARKRNFVNRFAALPVFEEGEDKEEGVFPIFKAVQSTSALDTMVEHIGESAGNSGDILNLLRTVFETAHMELVTLPTTAAARVRLADGVIMGPASEPPTNGDATQEPVRLLNYFVKPKLHFGIPPSCNLIFPSMVKTYTYQEVFHEQPTRTYVGDLLYVNQMQNEPLASNTLTFGYPPEIDRTLRTAQGSTYTGKNVLVFPEEFFRGPVVYRTHAPSWFTYLQNAAPRKDKDNNEHQRLQDLFALYTQYEHHRMRYEKRGGAVDCAWNPYITPGFPCIVFDNKASGPPTVGYVLNVTHVLGADRAGTMNTSFNYGFGRTLQEWFGEIRKGSEELGVALGSGPPEPIKSVREISQNFEQAEIFYNALFHQRRETPGRMASFDFREALGYETEEGLQPLALSDGAGPNNLSIAEEEELKPLPGFQPLFEDYDAALEYVSRPICTLDDYLSFLHGGKPVSDLLEAGIVEGPDDSYGFNRFEESGARYYTRIKRLRPGPGDPPPPAMTGVDHEEQNEGVPPDFPQTRAPWDDLLLAYREIILSDLSQE